MNKLTVNILVGGASALVGAIAGYIFCKKRLSSLIEDEVVKRVNEELGAIRRVNQKKKDEAKEELIESEQDVENLVQEIMDDAPELMTVNEYKRRLAEGGVDPNLVTLSPGYDDDDEEEELEQDVDNLSADGTSPDAVQTYMDEWAGRIEIVHVDDYRNLPSSFDFVTFHYFRDDDTLIDDKDEIIDDIDGTVGDALVHFGECDPNDQDTVYVVNGDYGLAIEIVRLNSSYANWNGWGNYYG